MTIIPGFHRIDDLDIKALLGEATQAGYVSYVLAGSSIRDRTSFFDEVRATLPLEPPLLRSQGWDALSDSLWEGLFEHTSKKILIVWPGASNMRNSAPSEFELAIGVLADVAKAISDPRFTCGQPKEVSVLVE
jgi:RNAse (barnase) inhibitor barstar